MDTFQLVKIALRNSMSQLNIQSKIDMRHQYPELSYDNQHALHSLGISIKMHNQGLTWSGPVWIGPKTIDPTNIISLENFQTKPDRQQNLDQTTTQVLLD